MKRGIWKTISNCVGLAMPIGLHFIGDDIGALIWSIIFIGVVIDNKDLGAG